MNGSGARLPGSIVALIFGACVLVLTAGYIGWRTLTGGDPTQAASMTVRPGMYDIRAEAAKRQASEGASQNGK